MAEHLHKALLTSGHYHTPPHLQLPASAQLHYPEKVIQFGSGALLRGFVDFFIDKANASGIFQGSVVVVNNTRSGRSSLLQQQEGLFTLCTEGFVRGETIREYAVNAAISRALPAAEQWPQVLACAGNPDIQTVVSNTTEVGIRLQEEDDLQANPPASFPGKLTAFLYARYQAFQGSAESGMLILPTELIPDNGSKLKNIILRLAEINGMEKEFTDWLQQHNIFCNTLVDRIVPGEPDAEKQRSIEQELGYHDSLLTVSEVYRLFAIEGNKDMLLRKAPFLGADEGIVIAEDITDYRERKLRILNGGHTISVAAGFLCGLETVYDCMQDEVMSQFVSRVIHDEIVPTVPVEQVMARTFADDVLDRFRNPFLNHKLLSITLQYSSKMNMRNGLTFLRYDEKFGRLPELMCAGFAAYLLFSRPLHKKDGNFYGAFAGKEYLLQDEQAAVFYGHWQRADESDEGALGRLVDEVLADRQLWEYDLRALEGFSSRVAALLLRFARQGVRETLADLLSF